jgi:hypothetical protein
MSTAARRTDDDPHRGSKGGPNALGLSRRHLLLSGTTLAAASALGSVDAVRSAQAQAADKPNILVIFGDDIGLANVSAYSHGLMGYRTPNIDRIAREGMMFIDYYAEQSCTAGRSTFITGQATLRTGLSKVGIPAAPVGLQDRDPTIAQLLKPLGYATGQFGKNHLGDKNEYLPTVHRLRRVLRQPLPPERRGGARELQLPEGPAVQADVRPARRAPLPGNGD